MLAGNKKEPSVLNPINPELFKPNMTKTGTPVCTQKDSKLWQDDFMSLFLENDTQTYPDITNSLLEFDTSSMDSPFSTTTTSTGSPVSSPEFQCNVNLTDSNNFSIDSIFNNANTNTDNTFQVNQSPETLDSIIQSLTSSDFYPETNSPSFGSGNPPSKKRKRSDFSPSDSDGSSPLPSDASNDFPNILKQISGGKKIFLSREQLLLLSSMEFDEYKQLLTSNCYLSTEEKDQLKKQRRVIKNREYSQNSRQKKRLRVNELEIKLAQMEAENSQLKKENQSLKNKIWKIVTAYNRTKSTNTAATQQNFVPCSNLSSSSSNFNFNDLLSIGSPSPAAKKAGICLFVVLLSFGFLFNFSGPIGSNQNSLNNQFNSRTGRIILSTEETDNFWVNLISLLSGFSSETDKETSIKFITTVTTFSRPTKFEPSSVFDELSQKNNQQQTMESWDDTHICDYESTQSFYEKVTYSKYNATL